MLCIDCKWFERNEEDITLSMCCSPNNYQNKREGDIIGQCFGFYPTHNKTFCTVQRKFHGCPGHESSTGFTTVESVIEPDMFLPENIPEWAFCLVLLISIIYVYAYVFENVFL